jgi:hypothetical protein
VPLQLSPLNVGSAGLLTLNLLLILGDLLVQSVDFLLLLLVKLLSLPLKLGELVIRCLLPILHRLLNRLLNRLDLVFSVPLLLLLFGELGALLLSLSEDSVITTNNNISILITSTVLQLSLLNLSCGSLLLLLLRLIFLLLLLLLQLLFLLLPLVIKLLLLGIINRKLTIVGSMLLRLFDSLNLVLNIFFFLLFFVELLALFLGLSKFSTINSNDDFSVGIAGCLETSLHDGVLHDRLVVSLRGDQIEHLFEGQIAGGSDVGCGDLGNVVVTGNRDIDDVGGRCVDSRAMVHEAMGGWKSRVV